MVFKRGSKQGAPTWPKGSEKAQNGGKKDPSFLRFNNTITFVNN